MSKPTSFGPAPEFDGAVEWLNCVCPPRISDFRRKIVLLHFWAYSSIHCVHVLAQLETLKQAYPNVLVLVGVHAPRYPNEKRSDSLRHAVTRCGITYPVANDANYQLMRTYGASVRTTLCLVDPNGEVAGAYGSHGSLEELRRDIAALEEAHRGTLDETPVSENPPQVDDGVLSYPGHVLADEPGGRLFISDSNHQRILICDMSGKVLDIAGAGEPQLLDGSFADACVHNPQGLALRDEVLYVADTGNHAIRALHLGDRSVTTFGGNGTQADFQTMRGGPDTSLSSPWGLAFVDNLLYIAMAGTHQIWRAAVESRHFRLHAGSGVQDLRDSAAPSAHLAQPSGIAYNGEDIYFVDSESGAIRRARLRVGDIETLVGIGVGEFGDTTGAAKTTRLQHPLGLCWHDGKVFIADTYNHRIKVLYPAEGRVEEVYGMGEPGVVDALNEPGGISATRDALYIADTNNHRILRMAIESREVEEVNVRFA